jgi:pimeloyl-ACP methyl ester carboxylesterase
VAPDQRGYGRTTGWDARYDGDLAQYRLLALVRDVIALVASLGEQSAAAVIGHDFGSPVAAWCALARPDVFRSVALMSAPFAGAPPLLPPAGAAAARLTRLAELNEQLAALPRPRKHYQWYYTSREANEHMWHAPQGVHAFLRAYYHHKSADWLGNRPHALTSYTADELAKLPTYYVMARDQTMAQTVAAEMPSDAAIAANTWLPESDLRVYSAEYGRNGFQGGLQWYRCAHDATSMAELQLFAGRTIDVPALYVSGKSDWGVYQRPGDLEAMQRGACTQLRGVHLIDGAGHWVQQEQPDAVNRLLIEFLSQTEQGARP